MKDESEILGFLSARLDRLKGLEERLKRIASLHRNVRNPCLARVVYGLPGEERWTLQDQYRSERNNLFEDFLDELIAEK